MPWKSSDATSHTKKANTPKKKRAWAKIANSWLKGHPDDDAGAIRRANAAIAAMVAAGAGLTTQALVLCMKKAADVSKGMAEPSYDAHSFSVNMSALCSWKTKEGKDYLVVPVSMMTVGVRNDGLYTLEELSKFPEAWNGRPVVIYHPKTEDGVPVSAAATPELYEAVTIGQIFNAQFVDMERLTAEAWIDPDKADLVDPDLMSMLEANSDVEVSIGAFIDREKTSGEFNGKTYSWIARNIRPDHLAALPREQGACSWSDGAGMPRVNSKQKGEEVDEEVVELREKASELGFAVHELSHGDAHSQLIAVLRGKHNLGEGEYVFIRDVYDKYVVYEHETSAGVKLYKQGYATNADDTVELTGDAVQVKPKTEYVVTTNTKSMRTKHNGSGSNGAVQADGRSPSTNTKGGNMDREDKVNALIEQCEQWTEEDRELLTNMSDKQFDTVEKLSKPEDPPKPAQPKAKEPTTNAEPAPKVTKATKDTDGEPRPKTVEDFLANAEMPPEVRDALQESVTVRREKKAELITQITANARNPFTEEYLQSRTVEELEGIARLAGGKRDYSLRATGKSPTVATHTEEPLVAPSLCGAEA